MIKKVILDKADRLYHFPFGLEDYFPRPQLPAMDRKMPIIDLGHFFWPIAHHQPAHDLPSQLMATDSDLLRLKEAIAGWLKKEIGYSVDPRREIYIGNGIRKTIFDFCFTYVEYGDIVLCPEPGLPVYRRHTIAAGGIPVSYLISERTGFKPSFKRLSYNLGKTAKILILNNPHNPLGVSLDETDLAELVRIASKDNIFIINDAAYSSLSEEKYLSILSLPGGGKVAVEIFSIPLTFGLPHIPFSFAVGPAEIISGLETIGRTTGVFIPLPWVQMALRTIGQYPVAELKNAAKNFSHSRIAARELADKFGWRAVGGASAPFLWLHIPGRRLSSSSASALYRKRRLLVLPGNAFGESGEGYIRLSLTAPADDFRAAGERLARRMIIRSKEDE